MTRYGSRTDGPRPGENQLTEAFAAVLEFGPPALAAGLLEGWGLKGEGAVQVETQSQTGGRRHIDLELKRPGHLCWVEIKHRASLHQDQLRRYREDLDARGVKECRLIVLAPAGFDDPELYQGFEDELASWQDIGDRLAAVAKSHDHPHCHEVWLVKQLIEYLDEEQLAMTRALTGEDIDAIERRDTSAALLESVLWAASEALATRFGRPDAETWYGLHWPRATRRDWPAGGQSWTRATLFGPS